MRREIKYSAIPTVFDGVQYRSKLEARTACFLKSYNIFFNYESIELDRYLPDFVIELSFGPVLLECKPAVTPREFKPACRKVTRSGWVGPAIILGGQLSLALVDDRPDLTLFGSVEAEEGGWSRVGRGRWPACWGEYPFADSYYAWTSAGNIVQYLGCQNPNTQ